MNESLLEMNSSVDIMRLRAIARRYESFLGPISIDTNPGAGWVVEIEKRPAVSGKDWFFCDFDDTQVATTEVKSKRQILFNNWIRSLGIDLPDETSLYLMSETDRFSRYNEMEDGRVMYHSDVHMIALQWICDRLIQSNNQGEPINEAVQSALAHLNEIQRVNGDEVVDKKLPFYFRGGRFMTKKGHSPWSKELYNIFQNTVITPQAYPEILEAMQRLQGTEPGSMNLGIITFGPNYYQLEKTLHFLRDHPDVSISQIWLSCVQKGEFLQRFFERQMTQRYGGLNVPFATTDTPHMVLVMDDDPKELDSVNEVSDEIYKRSGIMFWPVHCMHKGAKNTERQWDNPYIFASLDFTVGPVTPQPIINLLAINRFEFYSGLVQCGRMSATDPLYQALTLQVRGAGIEV